MRIESGSFTPTLEDSTSVAAESQAYLAQNGRYTRIGDMVFFAGNILMSSIGTMTGGNAAYIHGLPYAAETLSLLRQPVACEYGTGMAITAGHSVTGYVENATDYITMALWDATTGATPLLISEISASGGFGFHGAYAI